LPEPLVLLAARPLDAEVVRDLAVRHAESPRFVDRDLVRFDLGRPVDVIVTPVSELLARVPLSDVGELVEDIEIEDPLVPFLQVAESRDDVSGFVVDVHVHVLGDHINLAVAEDLLPEPVGEDRAESRGTAQFGEDIQDRMLPRSDFAVDSDGCHLWVPTVRVREKPIPWVAMNGTRVFGPRCPLSVRTSPPSPTGTQTRARVPSRSASAKRHSPESSQSPVAPLSGPPEPRGFGRTAPHPSPRPPS